MRPLTAFALAALLALPAFAQADPPKPKLSSSQCGLSTGYNVLVDGGGVWLYRDAGAPKEIFFHDGELSIDREVQDISAADAQRLRRLEAESRALMPQVAGLARETVDITFDSLAAAVEAITGSKRKARRLDDFRKDTMAHVDRTLGTGRWDQDVFGEEFEARVEAAAERMAASIGRSVLWAVFTPGGAERMERRAEKMEAEIEQRLEARIAALETRADAMCAQVAAMRTLQDALDYRYDGKPLRLLEAAERPARADDVAQGDGIAVAANPD
ncbi:DUF2884 family protein [Luteimonas marina]|uniref:DUF2884 family protein n=1 Tax=Luteimonas marina TaxID=488485 RepID=A0A5C5U961_9GAMM|nr:DUF2884 family protein [Luteimonas marina]TWT22469.1 DUF2884 family protein [Luteimonas marina]